MSKESSALSQHDDIRCLQRWQETRTFYQTCTTFPLLMKKLSFIKVHYESHLSRLCGGYSWSMDPYSTSKCYSTCMLGFFNCHASNIPYASLPFTQRLCCGPCCGPCGGPCLCSFGTFSTFFFFFFFFGCKWRVLWQSRVAHFHQNYKLQWWTNPVMNVFDPDSLIV